MEGETTQNSKRPGRGGRPRKEVKRDQFLAVKCTLIERKLIEAKAKQALLTVSELLRTLALSGKIDGPQKVLPKEVLLFTATLNHTAANLNQIARKRNGIDELNALERAQLQYLSSQIKSLAHDIKTYLK